MTLLTSPAVALLLRTTLLLGLSLLAVRLLLHRGPAVQTLAGRAALAAVALLLLTAPLTHFVPPLWHVPAPAAPRPAAPAPIVTLAPAAPDLEQGDLPRPLLQRGERGTSPTPTPQPPPHPPFRKDGVKQGSRSPAPRPSIVVGAGGFLLRLWATGTALLLLWLAVCQWHLTRLHRRTVLLTDGPAYDTLTALTPHPPRLYACPGLPGPFLAGLVRPAIYLPADHAETFSPDALRAVLAHELAHRDRHDTRWTLASRLLCALLWPQPLLWLLCRRLDQLAEDACDRAVLAHACPPRVYADCLLSLAERRPQPRSQRALVQGLVPFRSQLARRIQHILTAKGDLPMPDVTARLRLAIAATTVLVALGGTLLIAAPAQTQPKPAASPEIKPLQANSGSERQVEASSSQKRTIKRAEATQQFKDLLGKEKIALAESQMDYDLTYQQLTLAIRMALPQASSETRAKAFDKAFALERRIGWSLSALKLWKTSKAASLAKHHAQSVAKYDRFEGEALARLDRDTMKENQMFPKTARLLRQLPAIHALSEHLHEQEIKTYECRVEAEVTASMLRRGDSISEARPGNP